MAGQRRRCRPIAGIAAGSRWFSTSSDVRPCSSAAAAPRPRGCRARPRKGEPHSASACFQNSLGCRRSGRNCVWHGRRRRMSDALLSTRRDLARSPSTPQAGPRRHAGNCHSGKARSRLAGCSGYSAPPRTDTRLPAKPQPSMASRIQRCRCITGCSEFTPPLGSTTSGPGR